MKRLPNSSIRTMTGIVAIFVLISGSLIMLAGISEGKNAPQPVENKEHTPPNPFRTPAPEPKVTTQSEQNSSWIHLARQKMVESQPVRANVRQTVHIGNRQYEVTGSYSEGTDYRLRMELSLETPNCQGELLQVCDGQILWTELKRTSAELGPEGKSKITRCYLYNILQNAATSQSPNKANMISSLAMGGLTSLLASLENSVDFTQKQEITLEGKQLKLIEGNWKEAFLSEHGKQKNKKLARHIPERVRIYLDGETLFPRRIQYLKMDKESDQYRSLVTLDFADIVLNAPVANVEFQYTLAEGQVYDDVTRDYIRRLNELEK